MTTGESVILKANPGIVRDAFAEKDRRTGEMVFGLRQVKFNDHGSQPEVRLIRLRVDEAKLLIELWTRHLEGH